MKKCYACEKELKGFAFKVKDKEVYACFLRCEGQKQGKNYEIMKGCFVNDKDGIPCINMETVSLDEED